MDTTLLSGGPARAYKDVSGTLTDLGHLHGGIDVNIPEPSVFDFFADELGETPANGVFNGRAQPDTAVVRLAEITIENLALAIPNSVLITDSVTSTKKKLSIRAVAGTTLMAQAQKFVFKPIDPTTGVPSTDENTWVTIPKGVPLGATTLSYKKGEQRVIELTIRCLPDPANNYESVIYGDATATA